MLLLRAPAVVSGGLVPCYMLVLPSLLVGVLRWVMLEGGGLAGEVDQDLAGLLQSAGRLEEAMQLYLKILPIKRRSLGETHPETLRTVHRIGDVLLRSGKWRDAEAIYEVVLRQQEKLLGMAHLDTLATMNRPPLSS